MSPTHTAVVLGHLEVGYHRCPTCEFSCTDNPYWLDDAYTAAISSLDTGIMGRNLGVASKLKALLPSIAPSGPYVDWAGGLGILVRLMRDSGYDFYWQDKYSTNELARGFEWGHNSPGPPASAVTAIEALEHAPSPLEFLADIFSVTRTATLIFSQELCTPDTSPDWWYYAPESGQHVSFFSLQTLRYMARELDMQLATYRGLFIFSTETVSLPVEHGRLRHRLTRRFAPSQSRPSLTWSDHLALRGREND